MFPKNPINFPMNRARSQMLIRTRFARRFHRSMKKLNQKRSPSMSFRRRGHMVKVAAYASLASAVGSRRAWSRALLTKMRNDRSLAKEERISRLKLEKNPKSCCFNEEEEEEADSCPGSGLDGLRRLVPGGEMMDSSSLFDETAHYIKCLTIQIQETLDSDTFRNGRCVIFGMELVVVLMI